MRLSGRLARAAWLPHQQGHPGSLQAGVGAGPAQSFSSVPKPAAQEEEAWQQQQQPQQQPQPEVEGGLGWGGAPGGGGRRLNRVRGHGQRAKMEGSSGPPQPATSISRPAHSSSSRRATDISLEDLRVRAWRGGLSVHALFARALDSSLSPAHHTLPRR